MPAVNENTMTDSNNEIVTDFFDSVGTSSVTYTYTSTQTELFVRNESERTITVTINATPTAINAWSETTISAEFTSFAIVATGGHAGFYVRSVRGVDTTAIFRSQISTISGSATTPAIAPVGDANTGIFFPATDTIAFGEGGTEVMRINSSGNVGIGTNAPTQRLEVSSSSGGESFVRFTNSNTVANCSSSILLSTNTNSGAAISSIIQSLAENATGSTALIFRNANSGTSSERMRITSAGNVGIGTTSPANTKLLIKGETVDSSVNVNIGLEISDSTTTAQGIGTGIMFKSKDDNSFNRNAGAIDIFKESATTTNYANALRFWTRPDGNPIAERMRITSAGYALIGYTSSNGAYPLQVNGQIYATSATIATSDARYKENVVPLTSGLSIVNALNPVQFDWKQHPVHNFNTENATVGFIAQEVEQVLANQPYLNSVIKRSECEYEKDGQVVKEEFLGIAESNLIAVLTKAIQELSAKVNLLESQLASK